MNHPKKTFQRFAIFLLFGVSMVTSAATISHPFFRALGVVIVWGADNWSDNAGNAPIASDFVLMNASSGNAGNDIIPGDVYTVVSGTLSPSLGNSPANAGNELYAFGIAPSGSVYMSDNNGNGLLDASDSFSAFGVRGITDIRLRGNTMRHAFYVASNVPFSIHATAGNLATSGDFNALGLQNIRWDMRVKRHGNDGLAYGLHAQYPHSAGALGGIIGNNSRLDTFTNKDIFEGNQRTAASPGSIAEQSVRFRVRYELRRTGASADGYDLSLGKGHIEADVTYTIYVP